jgi:hypothetical protein
MSSMRLTHLGRFAWSRLLVTAVQPLLLGTTAIAIDGEQSSNDDSFSRKIQTRSVLEILVLGKAATPHQGAETLKRDSQPTQPRS